MILINEHYVLILFITSNAANLRLVCNVGLKSVQK